MEQTANMLERTEPKSIGIVGGMGRMGSMMGRVFADAGYAVQIADAKQGGMSLETIVENEVVILAVPIPDMEGVVREIGPYTRRDGVVIDIASIKQQPLRSMRQHCRGYVIGSHPLFGPRVRSLKDQIVFLCPEGPSPWLGWLRGFFTERGANVVEMDPERHDRLMAAVQVLRHILLLCFGHTLKNLDFEVSSHLPHSGQWFSQLVSMLLRQLEQPPELYADLAMYNPFTLEVLDHFLEACAEITFLYSSRDPSGLVRLVNEVSSYFLPQCEDKSQE
jgi:prephenate dehydrogenase